MKLLVVTQAVDENDPILGFFCRWLEEFATHYERIEVICLKEGKHTLPANVRVHSLGKEKKERNAIVYATRFKLRVWRLRHEYDAVFVHMNPEYVILGGLLWRIWNKKTALWYNHPHGGLRLALAARFADVIFYTSPYAATARYAKARKMPAGIDTELFKPSTASRDRSAIYLQGRVMPSKRIEIALEALRLLREKIPATLTIVGPEDASYGRMLRERFADLVASGAVTFLGPRANTETPGLYGRHGATLNLAAAGHFDKSVLESMACETPVVVSSKAFAGIVPGESIVPENNPAALAAALAQIIALPEERYRALGVAERAAVVREHSLSVLASTPYVRAAMLNHQYSKEDFTLVERIEDADYVLMPYSYERFNATNPGRVRMIEEEARKAGKPLLIDGAGDIEHPITVPNSVVLRVSPYRYALKPNEIVIPFPTEDLLEVYASGALNIRPRQEKPSVSFMGWAALTPFARAKLFLKELPLTLAALFNPERGAEHKGILFRIRALRALSQTRGIDVRFVPRATYSGHRETAQGSMEENRKAFVENLLGADYALCVKGDANSSVRFYEALSLGRIPLFLDTACVLPLEDKIKYRDFCVFVDWRDTDRIGEKLVEFHSKLAPGRFEAMQRAARAAYRDYLRIDVFSKHLAAELRTRLQPV